MAAFRTWVVSPHHVGLVAARQTPRGAQAHVGDAASASEALTTLEGNKDAGDTMLQGGDYASAVNTYKTAGQTAISAAGVGPLLDDAYGIAVTGPFTQAAFQIYAQLAAVNSNSPSQADATQAQTILGSMIAQYQQAANAGQQAGPVSPTPDNSVCGPGCTWDPVAQGCACPHSNPVDPHTNPSPPTPPVPPHAPASAGFPWLYVGLGLGTLVLGAGALALRARTMPPAQAAVARGARGWSMDPGDDAGEDGEWMSEPGW
jgi:hypothetical protein